MSPVQQGDGEFYGLSKYPVKNIKLTFNALITYQQMNLRMGTLERHVGKRPSSMSDTADREEFFMEELRKT